MQILIFFILLPPLTEDDIICKVVTSACCNEDVHVIFFNDLARLKYRYTEGFSRDKHYTSAFLQCYGYCPLCYAKTLLSTTERQT